MWNKADYDNLVASVPFGISVSWDVRPSAQKYGHVNTLLTVIRALNEQGATFVDPGGRSIGTLKIAPVKRKLTDKKKREFSILGHHTGRPLAIALLCNLQIEIYFNYHFFVETKSTYRQYFPSASVILRVHNWLESSLVPSPGSWGSDIICLTYDWSGTFVIETATTSFTGKVRQNFPGYKLAPARYKCVIMPKSPTQRERSYLTNNGFKKVIVAPDLATGWSSLSLQVSRYVQFQCDRL